MSMNKYLLVLVLALLSVSLSSQTVYPDFSDGVIYFKVQKNTDVNIPVFSEKDNPENYYQRFSEFPQILSLIKDYSVTELVRPFRTPCPKVQNTYRLKFDEYAGVDAIIRELESLDYIVYAEKNPIYLIQISNTPNDQFVSEQYYLEIVSAFEAWELAEKNYRPTIAIIDDGVKIEHPDLEGNIWHNPNEIEDGEDTDGNGFIDDIHGWDVSDNNNYPGPPEEPPALWGEFAFTHGTHCAGIAGAVANNEIGIAGVSNNAADIIAIKAVSNSSIFPLGIENAVEGVDYAIMVNADVISMSFGGGQGAFTTLENMINAGHDAGSIFVAAAGNDGNTNETFPAAYENVIAVGASTHEDKLWESSQRGEFIDILAPGVSIFSTLSWSTQYDTLSGTSMACPLVAGAIALLIAHAPDATNQEIIDCLFQSCDNIDDLNQEFIGQMGHGRLNLLNALICIGVNISYKLELSTNIIGAGGVSGEGEFYYGDMVSINAFAEEGFEFVNWTTPDDSVFSENAAHTFLMPNEDLSLTANFIDVSYSNIWNEKKVNISPNPFNDFIYINNHYEVKKVVLKNVLGKQIMRLTNPEKSIDTSSLPEGHYIISIELKNGNILRRKIVKP